MAAQPNPAIKQVENYYLYNYPYFCELSNWYYVNNKVYFNEVFAPLIKLYGNQPVPDITCPHCHQISKPVNVYRTPLAGMLVIIFGFLFAPLLIGILFIYLGNKMKEVQTICSKCSAKL